MGRGIQGKYNFIPPPKNVWPPLEGPDVTDAIRAPWDGEIIQEPETPVPGKDIRGLMEKLKYMERQGVDTWPPKEGASGAPINGPKPYGPERR